jgi:hypothetical protein
LFKVRAEEKGGAKVITYHTIVEQIEKLAYEAGQSSNEQFVREQLTAIRALCDVALVDKNIQATKSQAMMRPTNFVSATQGSQPLLNSSKKLEEDDANGESIFDF